MGLAVPLEVISIWTGFENGGGSAHPLRESFAWHAAALPLIMAGWLLSFPAQKAYGKLVLSGIALGFSIPLPIAGPLIAWTMRWLFFIRGADPLHHKFVIGTGAALGQPKSRRAAERISSSIVEILNSTDVGVRRRAIIALRALDPKQSVPVLQRAIQDSDEQVRLLAQTQFNRILATQETQLKFMESKLGAGPNQPAKLVQLAEQYHELVYLGLSSEETQAIHLGRAMELLQQALAADPNYQPARFLLLKCYLKSQRIDQARQCLEQLERSGFEPEFLAPWKAEILFYQRNWEALEQSLRAIGLSPALTPTLRRIVEFWNAPA